jgi:hypothetical protein
MRGATQEGDAQGLQGVERLEYFRKVRREQLAASGIQVHGAHGAHGFQGWVGGVTTKPDPAGGGGWGLRGGFAGLEGGAATPLKAAGVAQVWLQDRIQPGAPAGAQGTLCMGCCVLWHTRTSAGTAAPTVRIGRLKTTFKVLSMLEALAVE